MNTPSSHSLASGTDQPETLTPLAAPDETLHPDPITSEPGAHPAAVGVGALAAGAAGAALGAIAGPVGVLIGAAVGAIGGGLTGHEVAVTKQEEAAETAAAAVPPETSGFVADLSDEPTSFASRAPEPSLLDSPVSEFGAPTATSEGTDTDGSSAFSSPFETGFGEETIRVSAYHRYQERLAAGDHGDELSDWLTAEEETKRV